MRGGMRVRDVLLIHGYGSNPEQTWRETGWVRTLEDAGYRVHTPGLPGHGPNGGSADPSLYSPRALAESLEVHHIGRAHIISHSMGGVVATALAAMHPDLIESMSFIAFGPDELLTPFGAFQGAHDDEAAITAVDAVIGPLVLGALRGSSAARRASLLACAIGVGGSEHQVQPMANAIICNGSEDRFISDGRRAAEQMKAAYYELPEEGHTSILKSKEAQRIVRNHINRSSVVPPTVIDEFRATAQRVPDQPAVRFEDVTLTYRELHERACRVANALIDLGVKPGDAVATLGKNRLETVEEIIAIALAGAVRVPLYTHNAAHIHRHMLEVSGATVLIIDAEEYARAAEAIVGIDELVVIVHDGEYPGSTPYGSLLTASSVDPMVVPDPEAPFIIRFSSGTTGLPKAIMHRADSYRELGESLAGILEVDDETVQIIVGPMSHVSGVLVWPLMARGGTQFVMKRFSAVDFIECVRNGGTLSILVPTMIQDVLEVEGIDATQLETLKTIGYGGAPISEELLRRAIEVFPPAFVQLYGQSEVMPISALSKERHDPSHPLFDAAVLRSAGAPAPGVTVRIVNDAKEDVLEGELGEIAVRSAWNTDGLVGGSLEERLLPDGALLTRDIGWLSDGLLYVADRKDDMIISGGYNIWPKEVEDALTAHPAVDEAAVIGVSHPRWGETPVGVVTLLEGSTVDQETLIEWCREQVGAVKKPSAIVFHDGPLPRNGTGKVLRRELREQYTGEAE